MTSVCRVCLISNKRLKFMENKLLQKVYEKLSDTKFNSEEARPRVVCGPCHQKLQRCHAFSQLAHRSENIISQLFLRGLEVTHEDITELNREMEQPLSVVATAYPMDNTRTNESSHVTTKIEDMPEKEEVTSEEDSLVDIYIYTPDDTNASTSFSESKENETFNVHDTKKNLTSSLAIPTRTRAGNKIIACHICDKKFNQRANLYVHMRTHTGEKPYACRLCEKRYTGKTNLDAHMRTHTGEKPFACNACDKRFKQKVILRKHITKFHMGAKPFACHVCKEQFYKKHILVEHIMATHPGEKAFACNVCKKQFDRKFIFVDHMRIHTGEKPFSCNVCNKSFRSRGCLRSHIKTHARQKLFT